MNNTQQESIPLIEHPVENISIDQRANDGYINATALCKASNKSFGDYDRLNVTKAFMDELSRSMGIPIDLLIQKITVGDNRNRGTWVHPRVAINLAQWASPKFAVLVSEWVFEWMNGVQKYNYKFPYHIRRYLINRSKIPNDSFSMLDQMILKLLAPLEQRGYIILTKLMPDISLGKMFSKWLRGKKKDPDSFPTYEHVFDDGKRSPVQARLYPNELMTDFNTQIDRWISSGKALEYFSARDKNAIEPMKKVMAQIENGNKEINK